MSKQPRRRISSSLTKDEFIKFRTVLLRQEVSLHAAVRALVVDALNRKVDIRGLVEKL